MNFFSFIYSLFPFKFFFFAVISLPGVEQAVNCAVAAKPKCTECEIGIGNQKV